jgi:hypothetical protein
MAHSASYLMGSRTLSPWVKRPGRQSDNSLPSGAEVKKTRIYTFMA